MKSSPGKPGILVISHGSPDSDWVAFVDEAVAGVAVITSYSIHYTKLYDSASCGEAGSNDRGSLNIIYSLNSKAVISQFRREVTVFFVPLDGHSIIFRRIR